MLRLGLLAALVLTAGLAWLLTRSEPSQPTADLDRPASSAPPAAASFGSGPATYTRPGHSGRLQVDDQGNLVVSPATLRFFDSMWTAGRHEAPGQVEVRIRDAVAETLDAEAARQAAELLDDYLAYRSALARLDDARLAESADLERRLQWIRELRREHFGAARAEALFGEEEATTLVHLEMRRVAADTSLSESERTTRLAALEQNLPGAVRETRARATVHLGQAAEEQRLRDAGAGEAEIQALREERFGSEAAGRMRALDAERASFQARLEEYRTERRRLADGGALSEADLEELRASHFEEPERERVRLLDRIEQTRALRHEGEGWARALPGPGPQD